MPQEPFLPTGKWFYHVFVYTNEYVHAYHVYIQKEIEERSQVKYKTREKQTVKVFSCSQLGANQQSLGSQHLHLQSQDVQGGRGAVEARGAVGVARKRHLVLAGHAHHVHLPDALRFLPVGHAG